MNKKIPIGHPIIKVFKAEQIIKIDTDKWNRLSNNSTNKNPYYERWNLISAINHIAGNEKILIVTSEFNGALTSLYPIIKTRSLTNHIEIWKHKHCYESTPLSTSNIDLQHSINFILKSFSAPFLHINLHREHIFDNNINRFSSTYHRAHINSSNQLNNYLSNIKGKEKREINRLKRKLNHDYSINYFETKFTLNLLEKFCLLEDSGWKGKENGSINSNSGVKKYYQNLAAHADSYENMTCQILKADDNIIAMSIRILSGRHYYEIKTTYCEDYKKYAPGKILEYLNMHSLSNHKNIIIDSCTHHDNKFINNIWPNKISLLRTYIFSSSMHGQIYKYLYFIKILLSKIIRRQGK